jgi:ElaB/YqjD/DUF883 family membrane-anchored ribosome-binding protein
MQVSEIQADIADLLSDVIDINYELESAESCETKSDLVANLTSALESAQKLVKELKSCVESAKEAVEHVQS